MGIKNWLKNKIRNALNLPELEEQIREISNNTKSLLESQADIHQGEHDNSKFIIELDYPPSRDYQPRWGYTHPPHQGLIDLFNKNYSEYCETFRKLAKLESFLVKINPEFSHEKPGEPGWTGGAINAIDTALLYYFITEFKPKTYLEIGSGVTTLFAVRAKHDHNLTTRIVSIDPEPRAAVDAVCDEVIRAGLETTDLSVFFNLEPGDIVFMDGSHRSFMNSDVTVFMLDVLPKLNPGVVIHFHDIELPYDYSNMFSDWYWNEQYILAAYLIAAGDKVKILMPSRFMSNSPELKETIDPILKNWQGSTDVWLFGGSLWFTHVR
ncbi:class I SAM-dependent methyltransferase [Nostoc sp. C117]|uniref:class I SAM-dependent methyltransferase n=1 Tax=Nostoc sp. C117 TaxID=3349875 RepID=UPI00370DA00C